MDNNRNPLIMFQCEDNKFNSQRKALIECLRSGQKTMLMVSIETGILRANICRYISELQKIGAIELIRFGTCPISGCTAGFYELIKKS